MSIEECHRQQTRTHPTHPPAEADVERAYQEGLNALTKWRAETQLAPTIEGVKVIVDAAIAALPADTQALANAERQEDEAFERKLQGILQGNSEVYAFSKLREYAGVLSKRLREMDKRAKKANARADANAQALANALEEVKRLRETLEYIKQFVLAAPQALDDGVKLSDVWLAISNACREALAATAERGHDGGAV